MRGRVTKDEFIESYCKNSRMSVEAFNKYYVALPCACGYAECFGWAKVSNDPEMIEDHMRFFAPNGPAKP